MGVLVFSPHPDDATIACGGLIQQTHAAVCHVTAGDAYALSALEWFGGSRVTPREYRELGEERMRESQAADAVLGASLSVNLGFPDGCLMHVLGAESAVTSPYTEVSLVPYREALAPGVPYDRQHLLGLIAHVVSLTAPDVIVCPTRRDENETHQATAIAVRAAFGNIPLLTYVVHADHGLYPFPPMLDPERVLRPDPEDLPLPRTDVWLSMAERTAKVDALCQHLTQINLPMMGDWLKGFIARNEPFHVGS